tara:strand:+ start:2447 stop:3325 length:879 start_codon:yes stop_codon:yes gene_type:complete
MKTLKNLSVIILFVGFIFLTIYITKSYYVFNDLQYQEIVNKLLAEEKKRAIDSELVKQEKLPTKMFEIMFKKPTPWMGYTDDLTKDFNDGDKENEKQTSALKDENKDIKKRIAEISNKMTIIKNMSNSNKKEKDKLQKSLNLSDMRILKTINDLQKEQNMVVDNINKLSSNLKTLDIYVVNTEPIKDILSKELLAEYNKKLADRINTQKRLEIENISYTNLKEKIKKSKTLQKKGGKEESNQINAIEISEKRLLNQKLDLTSELSKLNTKLDENNEKIKSINSITTMQINSV